MKDITAQLSKLTELPENWNGNSVDAPSLVCIEKARGFLNDYSSSVNDFLPPDISASENGNVVLEWQNGKKYLTIYVTPDFEWYIKATKDDSIDDMIDGDINGVKDKILLWEWLNNNDSEIPGGQLSST